MQWSNHDKWAERMGIDRDTSKEVNRIIDAVQQGDSISGEYKSLLQSCARQIYDNKSSKTGFSMVAADYSAREHDASRKSTTGGDVSAKIHRCAMKRMGEDYLRCWYLHHVLDYLCENSASDKQVVQLLFQYKKEHPLTYSDEVIKFIRNNHTELADELGFSG